MTGFIDYEAIGRRVVEILDLYNISIKSDNEKKAEKQMTIDSRNEEKSKKPMRLSFRQMKGYEVSILLRDNSRNITFSSKITDDIVKTGFKYLTTDIDEAHKIVHFILSWNGNKPIRMTGGRHKNAICSSKDMVDNIRKVLCISPAIMKDILIVKNYKVDEENCNITFDLMR